MLDLDNDDDDGDEAEGIAEGEMKSMEQLDRTLTVCQKCGPSKYCKINKTGVHVNLTFGQRRGWAVALVTHFALQSASG